MLSSNRTRHAVVKARARQARTPARIHAGRHMRSDCRRYIPAQVAAIAVKYRPRKPAYKIAAARLALAA